MSEVETAVALLFDDAALGEQLRRALIERGARIVHEGRLADLSRELLAGCAADVLVVNLESEEDEGIDLLYELIEGEAPRVVFNDAQATRDLGGWDRARWARHLAMKVLARGDADPPRPVEVRPVHAAATLVDAAAPAGSTGMEQVDDVEAASAGLAAELEALLAAEADAGAPTAADASGDDEQPEAVDLPLHDDPFDETLTASLPEASPSVDAAVPLSASATPGDWQEMTVAGEDLELEPATAAAPEQRADTPVAFGDLELMPMAGGDATATDEHPVAEAEAEAAPVTPVRVSDAWSLVDEDVPAAPVARAEPSEFGIEKVSAADYLAPDVAEVEESPVVPGLSLELVAMEEAIAPQAVDPAAASEFILDEHSSVLSTLVVTGATTEGTAAVTRFLAALPGDLPVAILHTHHLAGRPADLLVEHLGDHCALPVELARQDERLRTGRVMIVPSDRQVRVRRDGSIELQPLAPGATGPSIDVSFSLAAGTFGRNALAIVFCGRSTDAMAGCQAVHDGGGNVWVEAGDRHPSDMVSAIDAEQLAGFAGTPEQLAAALVEHFAMEHP